MAQNFKNGVPTWLMSCGTYTYVSTTS